MRFFLLDSINYVRDFHFISTTTNYFQVVLVAQILCWTVQFIGHGIFEVTNFFVCDMVNDLSDWLYLKLNHVLQGRAPALLDNLVQAFLMAPFFVLLEVHNFILISRIPLPFQTMLYNWYFKLLQALQTFFGYEPYSGFHAIVQARIEAEINEWQDQKQKLIS